MKSAKYCLGIIVLITLLTLMTGCSAPVEPVQAEGGVLDLRAWDFELDGNVQLSGQWEFYWNKLVNYDDFRQGNQNISGVIPDLIGEVPNTWDNYVMGGANLPGEGYATYRLQVSTSLPVGTMLGMRMSSVSSAYRLYINERLAASGGILGTSALDETGQYRPQAVFFSIPASEFDIIIQVSNFQYARGGLWSGFYLGSDQKILDLHDNMMGKELFLVGALFIIALFYLAIYILRKELKYTLFFALLCFCGVLMIDMTGQNIITRIFPGIKLNSIIILRYASSIWCVVLLLQYVAELFPSVFAKVISRIYLILAASELLVYFMTPAVFFTRYGRIANFIEVLGILFSIVIVAIGIKKGHKDGWFNIMSMIILVITYVHDFFVITNVIKPPYGEISFGGAFLFILIQMVIQAERIKLFQEQKNAAELAFLQAQIKPHFLFNTLNTVIAISQYDIDKARSLLGDFSQYLRRSFDFKDLSQLVPLKNELELAQAYLKIEEARFEERLEVELDYPENLETKIPMLMLQPIIENAVIHGILPKVEGGKLKISIYPEGDFLVFKVEDNGVGLDQKELHVSRREKRRGVGLANIDRRLREISGRGLDIDSTPGKGTAITWRVPLDGRRRKLC